jgi:predicted N-acetyltransferase YhbS
MISEAPRLSAPEPLGDHHDLGGFDCGKPPLNDWLRRHALRNEGRASRTFVVCEGNVVVGYYALAVASVESRDAPRAVRRNMPPQVPVLVLGRLAVDLGHHGRGIGAGLLKDALRRALSVAAEVGVRAILVHAIDAEAVPFYTRYGFRAFPEGSLTFFLPMEEMAAALG